MNFIFFYNLVFLTIWYFIFMFYFD